MQLPWCSSKHHLESQLREGLRGHSVSTHVEKGANWCSRGKASSPREPADFRSQIGIQSSELQLNPCLPGQPHPQYTSLPILNLPFFLWSLASGFSHNSSCLANLPKQLIFCFHQVCSLGIHSHSMPWKKMKDSWKTPRAGSELNLPPFPMTSPILKPAMLDQLPKAHSAGHLDCVLPFLSSSPKPSGGDVKRDSARHRDMLSFPNTPKMSNLLLI